MKKSIALLLSSALLLSACSQDKEVQSETTKQEEQVVSKEEQAIQSQFHPAANDWYEGSGKTNEKVEVRDVMVAGIKKHLGIQTNLSLDVLKGWDKQGSKGDMKDRFYWDTDSNEPPISVKLTKDTPFNEKWKDTDGYYLDVHLVANAEDDIDRLNWYIHKNTFEMLQELSRAEGVNIDGLTVHWKVPVYKDKKKEVVTFRSFEDLTITLEDIQKVKTTKDVKASIQTYGADGFFHAWSGTASFTPEFEKDHEDFGKFQLVPDPVKQQLKDQH